jgi:hypothetical protein
VRVLRLDLTTGALDLHPFVTVARGLAPAARAELVDVLTGVPAGRAPVGGLIEAHGVMLDLDAETLDLLDLREELPVIVSAGELPAVVPESARLAAARAAAREAERSLTAAEAALEGVQARLDAAEQALNAVVTGNAGGANGADGLDVPRATVVEATRERVAAEVAVRRAETALAAAEQDLADAEAEANTAREQRAAAMQAVAAAAAALEAAADQRDSVAVAALETARQRVAAAEEAVDAARTGRAEQPPGEEADEVDDDGPTLDALRAERLEVEAAVLALDTPDPFPIRLALEQVAAAAGTVDLETSPEAIRLADRWAAIDAELDDLHDRAAVGGERRAEALGRVRSAREAVASAEAGRRPGVDADDIADLEAAHAEVLAARDAAERRLGGRNARRRVEEATAAEQEILDRLGIVTYAEYLMGGPGRRDVPDDDLKRLAAAREELAEAESALAKLNADVAGELRRAELLQQRRSLRSAAVDLLEGDPGDDVEAALRRHRVPVGGGSAAAARLAQALEGVGLVLGDEVLPESFLVDLAKVWLEEQERVSDRRLRLESRIADLDVRIADRQRAESEPEQAQRPALTRAVADLENAKAELRSASSRVSRHEKSESEVLERRTAFEAATKDEASAVTVVGAAEAVVIRRDEARRQAARDLEVASGELDQALHVEQQAALMLSNLESQIAAAAAHGLQELEEELRRCETDAAEVRAEVASRALALADANAALAEAEAEESPSGQVATPEQALEAVENTEWYLLARLAAQRAASYAGSVPLVLDDALSLLDPVSAREVLDRLERMAATVQVVVLTEDLSAAAWATQLGPERAAVVEVGVTV